MLGIKKTGCGLKVNTLACQVEKGTIILFLSFVNVKQAIKLSGKRDPS